MTEKQPDWIRKHFEEIMLDWQSIEDCWWWLLSARWVLEYIQEDLLPEIMKHLPQESTYESGYWTKELNSNWQDEFNKILSLCNSNEIKRLMQRMLHKHWKLQQDNLPKLLYEDGYKKKIRKLKNQWTATRRKRKWCSYEEERCMLTIINDLESLLSPTDTK